MATRRKISDCARNRTNVVQIVGVQNTIKPRTQIIKNKLLIRAALSRTMAVTMV